MHSKLIHWRTLIFLGAVPGLVAVGAVAFALLSSTTTADTKDWPPVTMTYQTEMVLNNTTTLETRRLTYNSKNSWVEEVIAADPIEVKVGVFSTVGSYQKLENGVYTTYDAFTGTTDVEKAEKDSLMIPRLGLMAVPIEDLEDFLGEELTPVHTSTTVCFEFVCTDNAPGWEFRYQDVLRVYADDARGIPVKIGDDFNVIEVKLQGERRSVR